MSESFAAARLTAALGMALVCALSSANAFAQAPPPSAFPGEAPPGPPANILYFDVEPAAVDAGRTATLRWEVLNAFELAIEPGIGAVATRGSMAVQPTATTTYKLRAAGSGGSIERSVTVTVDNGEAAGLSQGSSDVDPPATRSVPRLADGRPDLSGVFIGGRDVTLVGAVELRQGAEDVYAAGTGSGALGPGVACFPPGVPAATMMPFPLQIVHKPDVVAIMYEAYHLFRIIPIGVPHADYLPPAWMGHSVAHWDGDTLVVEVAGFNDRTRVAGYGHSENMRVTERYRRTSIDTIEYEAIVEDPAAFAEPIRFAGDLTHRPEWTIGEYVCAENALDYSELLGD